MNKPTDNELISRTQQGDHRAYAELVGRYKDALYRQCFAMMQDEDMAEDIAQETFVTAYYKLASYNNEYKFATWLFKIGTNKALNALKKTSKVARVDDDFFDRQPSTLLGPDRSALHGELEAAITSLKPKYQLAIRLHYWQGLSYAQIAEAMEVSEGTVKSLLYRAKSQLRKDLS